MTTSELQLNQRAASLCDELPQQLDELRIAKQQAECGATLFDFGIDVAGSQQAGLLLARICLADLAEVDWLDTDLQHNMGLDNAPWPQVAVQTDHPVAACMASQYAGWEVKGEKFFAMGSGPMRAAAGREPLFDEIGLRERSERCVGVLESSKLPPDEVCREIAEKCGIDPDNLTLLVAPTSSLAGTIQVVARSTETALHKLHELGFDLSRIKAGGGIAEVPPVAKNDLAAIGVTNDAILYGGHVILDVTGDDASLEEIGPRVPSSASKDYGKPFAEVMKQYNNDFYQIDPLLFSAAVVTFKNRDTGNRFEFGELNSELIQYSFDGV